MREKQMLKAGFSRAIMLAVVFAGHGARAQAIPPSPEDFVMAALQSDQYGREWRR
jgi:hypothetical protein